MALRNTLVEVLSCVGKMWSEMIWEIIPLQVSTP